jgi:oxygen-independent coproporphyrinogen-3 oxidase
MSGIYIHIPFCRKACHYCDFHFSTNLTLVDQITDAICKEIVLRKNYVQSPLNSIYFGGGTPSLLSANQLNQLINNIYKNFTVAPEAEITLEANPDDLNKEKLTVLKNAGINRLSIGIQSFQDARLLWMNRSHNAGEAINVVNDAREAGFENLSIDLIYGLPDQNHKPFLFDLEKAISLNTDHISAYCLTIEPKTVFGHFKKKGMLKEIDEDLAAEQFEILVSTLSTNGYEQYEISNFAKNGKYAIHNTAYWQQKPYLGVGPSAHSYNQSSRQFNVTNNQKYLRAITQGAVLFEKEQLSRTQQINEYIMTSLRTMWGYNHQKAFSQFDFDIFKEKSSVIDNLLAHMLITKIDNCILLTAKGKLQADWVAGELFL